MLRVWERGDDIAWKVHRYHYGLPALTTEVSSGPNVQFICYDLFMKLIQKKAAYVFVQ